MPWSAGWRNSSGPTASRSRRRSFKCLSSTRRGGLFSDRFLTSSFRPEFYTHLGVQWINDNGPDGKMMERGKPNGHEMEVSPLKRVLAADHSGAQGRARSGRQRLRSVGARPGRILFAAMETAPGRGERPGVQPLIVECGPDRSLAVLLSLSKANPQKLKIVSPFLLLLLVPSPISPQVLMLLMIWEGLK